MKEIEHKHTPEVSGGTTTIPPDGPCFPPFPSPDDYPRTPTIPRTDDPVCPDLSSQ